MTISKLNRYYIYGILPAFIICAIITFYASFIDGSFFMLGFIWPYSYYTPGIEEKLINKYGRFSFLNISFISFIN